MSGHDYLWDGSGPVDPEVARLEGLLEPLRIPDRAWSPRARTAPRRRLAAAAALLLGILGASLYAPRPGSGAWDVMRTEGVPWIAGRPLHGTGSLANGQWLETDARSRASVSIGRIGRVDVGPDSRLRPLATGRGGHWLDLQEGSLLASIYAPPGEFVVRTPSATAIDLGCVYALTVDASGAGVLRVLAGWVAFEHAGRESFVPEDAECRTRPGAGPGTPHMRDTATALGAALDVLDFDPDPAARAGALRAVLATARHEDALTLWHLLSRVDAADRGAVHDGLGSLVPPPAGVTRAGIVAGDASMRDRWWAALGHGDVAWWRKWKTHAPFPGGDRSHR